MKRVIIIGASSGIGRRIADQYIKNGWRVGVAARRQDRLEEIRKTAPDRVMAKVLDVTAEDAAEQFEDLIELMGGMDLLVFTAGVGWSNPELDLQRDMQTVAVNVGGFTRIVNAAYRYYRRTANVSRGQIAVITSVAGTKGIGVSATYSASKRYEQIYLEALDQLARRQRVAVDITDIRPGFIDTDLLDKNKTYPMEMQLTYAVPKILRAIERRRKVAVIDWRWNAVVGLWRLIPSALWRRMDVGL